MAIELTTHQAVITRFLGELHPQATWRLRSPSAGTQRESYFASSQHGVYFVKINANIAVYEIAAALGITPPIVASGLVADDATILVQQFIRGTPPVWSTFQNRLSDFAAIINTLHHAPSMRQAASQTQDTLAKTATRAVQHVIGRWQRYREQVPQLAGEVDMLLSKLASELSGLDEAAPVASHNDLNMSNWIVAESGALHLLDFDMLTLDDPAQDMGMLLWWYYPPALRSRFLELAGHEDSDVFRERMRLRMTLHSLSILLPREDSFDQFDGTRFAQRFGDVRAVYAGKENPRGYDD